MDMKIDKNKTGLTFGFLFSSLHLIWSILVAFGIAQTLLNFILSVHMINMPIMVTPFDLIKALTLIVVIFIVGYVFGWLMAFFWNKCFK